MAEMLPKYAIMFIGICKQYVAFGKETVMFGN